MLDPFSNLMEFAVAIAGFSGISIAIQSRNGDTDPLREFRNRNLITWSLCAAFGATLPDGIAYLGGEGAAIWSWSSGVYSLFLLFVLTFPYSGRAKLSPEERKRLSPIIWVLGVGGTALVALAQIVNVLGWLDSPNPAPLYWGLLWMILFASMQFYRNLFGPN